jgi:hypothetical protein
MALNKFCDWQGDQETVADPIISLFAIGRETKKRWLTPLFYLLVGTPAQTQITGLDLTGYLMNPQNMNSYSYVKNNPVNRIDPNGMFDLKNGIVEKGDNLTMITDGINAVNGISYSVSQIAKLNGISNPDHIEVGQQIIPNMTWLPDITNALQSTLQTNANDASIKSGVGGIASFVNKVKSGGPWDYKNQPGLFNSDAHTAFVYDGEIVRKDFPGNVNFGYTGASTEWGSTAFLLGGAGAAQTVSNLSNGHAPSWGSPYWDNPGDSAQIMRGINYYNNGF